MLLCIPAAAILVLSSLVPGQTACNVLKKAADDPDCQAFASPGQLIDVSETPTSTKEKMLKNLLACITAKKLTDKNRFYFKIRFSKEDSRLMERTGLMLAAEAGLNNIAKDFLHLQSDLDIRDYYGFTATILAAKNGNVDILDLISDAGGDMNDKTNIGNTALMFAAKNGYAHVVASLLQRHADTNLQRKSGWTALIDAARRGYESIVNALLKHGAKPNLQNDDG